MSPSVEARLKRIREGAPPRVLDLFSGCGGLALGFVSAGCVSVGGVELDEHAAKSYALNFHRRPEGTPDELHALPKDILKWKPQGLLERFQKGFTEAEKGIDLLVGGPPCPAFTRVGRAKLREVHQHPEAFKRDRRATLYVQYLEYVRELRPLALVMENVPDVLNWGGYNLGDEICDSLEDMGYRCAYTLLNAASYGVPQMRERFFLVAILRKAKAEPGFPIPTRRVEFPPGYLGSRMVALKNVRPEQGGTKHPWYQDRLEPVTGARPAVTAHEALSDLPPLTDHITGLDRRGARRLNGNLAYRDTNPGEYARLMRKWSGFESDGRLRDHVTRCLTDRDYRLFEQLEPGDDYPKAHALATKLFQKELKKRYGDGESPTEDSPEYKELHAKYVPPYDPGKFPNKWRKMAADEPARTLMAHLGKDTYSHIHYDSKQKRVISVREAARLQSFPDGFRFSGTMNPAFRQIGNSVPPLLAWAIADELLLRLEAKARKPSPERAQEARSTPQANIRVA